MPFLKYLLAIFLTTGGTVERTTRYDAGQVPEGPGRGERRALSANEALLSACEGLAEG